MANPKNRKFSNVQKYSFNDLFDIDKIQQLQDLASTALGIGMVMTAPDGTLITKNSHYCNFCEGVIRTSEKGRQNCMLSDLALGRPNKGGPLISRCLSAGLLDAGASIMIGDVHVASWNIGQLQDENEILSEEENKKRAVELGIDPELYCREIKKVPCISMERFQKVAELIYVLANQISELGLKNYLQKEELSVCRELERQMKHNNEHDRLTSVYNRMYYEAKITELILKEACPVSVVVADVNYLKLSNDIFGHTEGDCLLQQISGMFVAEAGPEYIICRCGGDEFSVFMPNSDYEEAEDYVRRIRERCLSDYCTVLPPSIALGVGTKRVKEESLVSVIKHAEDQMYLDKHKIKQSDSILSIIRRQLYETKYITPAETERTKKLALLFAHYLELDVPTIDNLNRLLEMQHMGLIVVPKDVLTNTNQFIDYELEARCRITEIEYRLSKMFDFSLPIARIISQRHEQWNGYGKPNQLKGEEIDFLARFISVVNCYILLTNPRPHGFAKDVDYAIRRTAQNAGVILDPGLTEAFVTFMSESNIDFE